MIDSKEAPVDSDTPNGAEPSVRFEMLSYLGEPAASDWALAVLAPKARGRIFVIASSSRSALETARVASLATLWSAGLSSWVRIDASAGGTEPGTLETDCVCVLEPRDEGALSRIRAFATSGHRVLVEMSGDAPTAMKTLGLCSGDGYFGAALEVSAPPAPAWGRPRFFDTVMVRRTQP